jgi:hypothetical protein
VKIAKKRLQQALTQFKQGFADRPTRALDELLSSDVVCSIVDEEVGAHRERVYPPLTTLGLFIGQALCVDGACQDAVARHLSERTAQGEPRCSLSSGPYCKARSRLPLRRIERLAVSVGERLEDISCRNWKWRGRSVKLLDGTTVSMPDTAAYFTVAMLAEHGVDLLTRQHQRRGTDFRQGQRLGPRDRLVTWIRPQRPQWMDAATCARMPQHLSLRQTEVAGRILVTTLTDVRSVAPLDLDTLYRSRWQVEVDLRSMKAVMGMDILRAKSPSMIDKEIAVHLLAYNLVRGLMARTAAATAVIARALSFKGVLQLLLAFQQQLRWAGRKCADIMSAHLLGAISAMKLPIRPGRVEPRAIKRRPKPHALLTVPRQIARAKIIRAREAYA